MALSKLLFSLSNNLVLTVAGILGIGFIIAFHEFGHFIFCKVFKVRTNSFAIGYGPKLLKKKIGETEFSIGAVPLGGYVEMASESPKGPTDPALFTSKPLYQKLSIIFGGITFNLLFAYLVLCAMFLVGLPKSKFLYPLNTTTKVAEVQKDSPAEKFGILPGDSIIALDGKPLGESAKDIFKIIKPLGGKTVAISIDRAGEKKDLTIELESREVFGKSYGSLGVIFEVVSKPGIPFLAAIAHGVKLVNAYLMNTIRAYKHILAKRDTRGLGGPVMIISETIKGASKGLRIFLLFLAIISINLAVLNLIPLPILDGGQALLYTIEGIIRRQIPERTKEIIFIICWIGMLALFVYLSAKDIWRIISPWFVQIKGFFRY